MLFNRNLLQTWRLVTLEIKCGAAMRWDSRQGWPFDTLQPLPHFTWKCHSHGCVRHIQSKWKPLITFGIFLWRFRTPMSCHCGIAKCSWLALLLADWPAEDNYDPMHTWYMAFVVQHAMLNYSYPMQMSYWCFLCSLYFMESTWIRYY